MTATLKDVKKRAKELGASVTKERQGDTVVVYVTAPKGKRWEHELHEFVDSVHYMWPNDYDDLLQRMSYGLEECDDPQCEWCHPSENDE